MASANDCSVALAEHLAGSADAFVEKMNQRAGELGMNDTNFLNPTGLPAQGHVTSAYDIALMSRELVLRHPDVRRFTTIQAELAIAESVHPDGGEAANVRVAQDQLPAHEGDVVRGGDVALGGEAGGV